MSRSFRLVAYLIGFVIAIIIVVVIASPHGRSTTANAVVTRAPATAAASTPTTTSASASAPAAGRLSLVPGTLKLSQPDATGLQYVTGEVKNSTNRAYTFVQVDVNAFDANGVHIENAIATVNHLAPGGTWKFKTLPVSGHPARVELAGITGY